MTVALAVEIPERVQAQKTEGYEWSRSERGTYSLHNLELCEPHVFPLSDGTFDVFDIDRMQRIFKTTRQRIPRGIGIIGHKSGFNEEKPQVAVLEPKHITPTGRVFGDITEIEPTVFQQIVRGRLRNRSVEFEFDLRTGVIQAIEGVAFLGHNRGFFPYPEMRPRNFGSQAQRQLRRDVEDFVMPGEQNVMRFRSRYAGNREKPAGKTDDTVDDKSGEAKKLADAERQTVVGGLSLDDIGAMLADMRAIQDETMAAVDAMNTRLDALEGAGTAAASVEEVDGAQRSGHVDDDDDQNAAIKAKEDESMHRAKPIAKVDKAEAERSRKALREEWRGKIDSIRVSKGVAPTDDSVEQLLDDVVEKRDVVRQRYFERVTASWQRGATQADARKLDTSSEMPEDVAKHIESYPEGAMRERARGLYTKYLNVAEADRAERSRDGRGAGQSLGLGNPVSFIKSQIGSR